jgi:trigger factor
MKVEKKILPKSIVELTIEESAANVAKFRKTVIASASKNADIKGFRKGVTIPEDVIVRQFGEEVILQMTIEKAIEGVYKDTLKKENLMPVSQAEIQEVISQNPLIVRIQVEVFPSVEIKKEYKKVKLTRTKLSVSVDEVKAALEDIETRFTHFHDTDAAHTAHMGDRVTIDTDGYEKGEILESTSMRDYPLVLGSNMLVPGFEEDMVGMKVGDEKEIDVTFPTDYHNTDFAGKKTQFKVSVKKIEHAHKPEFTPEFIEQLRGQKLDLAGFKKLIKSELLETKEANDGMEREMKLIEELLKHTTLDLGEKLIEQQTDQVFEEIKQNITKDGVKVEDYLASLGLSIEEYKKQHVEATAIKRLQGEIILNEIMLQEKIEVTDADMKTEVENVIKNYQAEDVLKRLEELYVPGSKYFEELRRRVALRRLIDTFFSEAK